MLRQRAYFITGTDTDVGKTYVASALLRNFVAQGWRAVGMKPVATGDGQPSDVQILQAASNVDLPTPWVNPYHFVPAIAPHIAAQQEGTEINLQHILGAFQTLSSHADVVVVEGAGGFYAPLNASSNMADLALMLNIPVILVVGMRLGCLNHALLSVEAITQRGLPLAGWVANSPNPLTMSMLADNID
ncbi:MAG: dethiobiotin synthase, partial [Methylophilaceae bacterium]|nr:dethiobiotin synthase [Methylophilaceae bacterium]